MAEEGCRPVHELAQRPVIRLIEPLDPPQGLIHRDPAAVDLLPIRNDSRNRAEPARDTHGTGVRERWETTFEHPRIEFVWLPVQIEQGSRESGCHYGRPEGGHRREELVHIGVL